MPDHAEIMEWRGNEVVDQDGDKVGKLDEIYVDRETGQPEWAIVNTGLFGRKSSFVPLKDALREGEMIRVPYQKEQIKDAPNVDPDGEISQEDEQRVYAHYGIGYSETQSQSGLPQGGAANGGDAQQAGNGTSDAATGGDTATPGGTGTAGDTGTATSSGDADTSPSGDEPPRSGVRLQRMFKEDVRLGGEGDEVVERRTVEETRVTPDNQD
jgi:sporulation protein YlmC with PRC-barrel domain